MNARDAQPSDLPFLIEGLEDNRAIEGRAAPATPADVSAFEGEIERGTIRVLEDDGEAVGFVCYRLDFPVMYVRGRFLWIDLVYVHRDRRGTGLGRKLYEEAVRLAEEHGCARVVADVFAANTGSIEFHRRAGFEPLYTIFTRDVDAG